jgi:hypothetical protein
LIITFRPKSRKLEPDEAVLVAADAAICASIQLGFVVELDEAWRREIQVALESRVEVDGRGFTGKV